jgi:hypothetical protein
MINLTSQTVLDLYILPCRQLREEAHLLKKHTEVVLTDIHPLGDREMSDILIIKTYLPTVVMSIPHQVTAKRTLPHPTSRFHEIGLAALKANLSTPYVRDQVLTLSKNLW